MNRLLFCLLSIFGLLGVQAMSLHAHLPHAQDEHAAAAHHHLHIHSHMVDENLDADPDHPDAAPIDLLTSALSRDQQLASSIDIVFQSVLILTLLVAWICIQRLPPPVSLDTPPSPRLRKPSSRAPPF